MIRWLTFLFGSLVLAAPGSILSPPSTSRAGNATLVKDIWPTAGFSSYPAELTVMEGTLYFTAIDDLGRELWMSDGTTEGTVRVKDIVPGIGESSPRQLTVSGGKLFFAALDASYERELWVSDGTEAGTVKLDINPTGGSDPDELVDVGGVLYFSAYEPNSGRELWRSDGTVGGTVIVADVNIFGDSNPMHLTPAGSLLYFTADFFGMTGQELFVSDGTASGTVLLKDIQAGSASSYPDGLTVVGSSLFFQATSGGDAELYVSDGTAAGTVLVKNINPSAGSYPRDLGAFGGVLLFSADDGSNGYELWRSDGTAAGTYLVKNIDPGPLGVPYPYSGYSFPRGFMTLTGVSLFSADEPATNRELWRTDGTEGGTYLVRDITPGSLGWVEPRFTVFGGELYFDADDGTHGSELWKTDGTAGGTVLACDIKPGPESSVPIELTVVGDAIYFNAHGVGVGHELYRFDPTATPVIERRPARLSLSQNYPNPFNPETMIAFELEGRQHVSLSVFDVRGKLVRVLLDRTMPGGPHQEAWDGRDADGRPLASGVYFLRLRTPDRSLVRKAVMLK